MEMEYVFWATMVFAIVLGGFQYSRNRKRQAGKHS
jgi:hypothetical protein